MTHFREAFLIALHCMRVGRLRTVLTMSGIVLSISLVISMHGLNAGVEQSYDQAPSVIRNVVPMLNGQAGIRRGAMVRSVGVPVGVVRRPPLDQRHRGARCRQRSNRSAKFWIGSTISTSQAIVTSA
jgi:ABC-type antimicrobial peptide transport system permease subunit